MTYRVYYPTIQQPGAPFSSIRQRTFKTLDAATAFMRKEITDFINGLTEASTNDGWRSSARLAIETLDALPLSSGHNSLGRYWTNEQGGVDGRITVFAPAPSMTLEVL